MIISENASALSFYMPVFRLCLRSFLGFARDDIARDESGEWRKWRKFGGVLEN